MKGTRFAVYAAAIVSLFALVLVAGCGGGGGGGSITNTVNSQWNGSLVGVETIPPNPDYTLPGDDDTSVPRDSWINVYWPASYDPPRQFTVTVEKQESPGNYGGIHTRLSSAASDPANADWWFQPVNEFSPFTWYRIVIRAEEEATVYVYFETTDLHEADMLTLSTRSAASATGAKKSYRPANATNATGEDSVTHTITVPAKK